MVKSYKDLEVWQQAVELAVRIYGLTKSFPADERFGLTSQMRRAAVSIPSNIAEGQGRRSTGEFLNQLSVARGSLMELETQLELGNRLGLFASEPHVELSQRCASVGKLLNGLMRALETRSS